jgi:radical SAM protein with 4Fe4S-binding SPASM domain
MSAPVRYYLAESVALKWLESPCLYDIREDELYELDEEGFAFLRECTEPDGGDPQKADPAFAEYCFSEGLLTRARINIRRPPVFRSQVPSLRYLELQITDKCNLKCRHCYLGNPQNKELSIPQLRSLLDEFEAMQGLRLLITGGEPLMHSRFSEINGLLADYAFRKILFTNGLLLDMEMIKSLRADELQFSVDGMEHGHEALRGHGTFRKVMNALEMSMESGMTVSVATMVHSENISEFKEMEALFLSLGIRDWTVDVPCSEGNLYDNKALCVPPETGGKLLAYGFGKGLHGSGEGFGCGLHLAAVLANGDICKCAFYSGSPAGHIRDGLSGAWARVKPVNLAELECSGFSCPELDECRGGCRYRASVLEKGEIRPGAEIGPYGIGRDFYKCFYYGIMK